MEIILILGMVVLYFIFLGLLIPAIARDRRRMNVQIARRQTRWSAGAGNIYR